MQLDVHTLFLVTTNVEGMLGLLLLFAWVQNTAITAVAWWAWAHLLRAVSIGLFGMYGATSAFVTIEIANALLLMSVAFTWTGARVFGGRSISPFGLIAGALVWLVVVRLPGVADTIAARIFLSSAIIACYTWMAAFEFWRGRDEPLVSRWPAIVLLFADGALFLLRTPMSLILPWVPGMQVFDSIWMSVLSFEALLFTIAIAFILLAMAKERTEFLHKTASLVDPLTGIANRRAFFQGSEEMARRVEADPRPVGLLLIDLDHFKLINDNYGHAFGDHVLQIFAKTANAHTGADDIVGRLGGEEFAVLLYDADHDHAITVAEELRNSFAGNTARVDGFDVGATASIGVAVSGRAPLDVHALLAQADEALYRAKERGRNRVETSSLDLVLKLDSSTPSLRIPGLAQKHAA